MGKIKFDDVMNFYPKHNRSTFNMIVKAQKSGNLIPFVGAGMSVFCGYKPWGAVLSELAEFILTEDERQAVLKQIDNGAYEEAAQMILEAYPAMLDQLPNLISPNKIKNCPREKLKASAVFALPYLFQKGLVITTNFDRVLETVYLNRSSKQIEIVTPNQQDRLAQLRQNQTLGLFKLHGDIGSDTVSIDDLVFTGKQYTEKYTDKSPLVQELTRWFENRMLLFLGCSLNVDRTMEVLRRVSKAQPGIRHYAVIGCKKSDISNRLKELMGFGILPVFYDDSDHDAVRIILERLLEETNQESYIKLQETSQLVSAETKEERRLMFDADYFPFTGRKNEMESLEAFCASDDDISWWVVTGPGGMGKSRLVYEFANRQREDGWQIEHFEAYPSKGSHAKSIATLGTWNLESSRTIVILDDVQAHMELVRQWLNKVVRIPRSEKLRILLLEREGKDARSSYWLGVKVCDDIPVEWCYEKKFLYLSPMSNADLITIMDDYAAAAGKKLNAELLLNTLERVDPGLKRPLYALAIADARCQGKDPANWDRKKVLDTLLDRELGFHINRFKGMTEKRLTKTLRSELKELLACSCVCDFLFLGDVEMERYPNLVRNMEDLNMDLQEFLEGLGVLHTVLFRMVEIDQSGNPIGEPSEESHKIIALSCPALIKEHLVLNMVLDKGKSDQLFPHNWVQEPSRLKFLEELLVDYSDRLREQSGYWNTIFRAAPQDILCARLYGRILWGYIAEYPDNARVAIDRLMQLYDEMGHAPEIALEYAVGLLNLTVAQDLKRGTEAVARLEELYQEHPDILEIAGLYAADLVNLIAIQDLKGRTETVARLGGLHQKHPDILDIAIDYAIGLFELTDEQDLIGCMESVARLEALYQSHPDLPDIAVGYAKGLVNLTGEQDLKGRMESVARLEALYQSHPDLPDIAVDYATGLINLTDEQDLEGFMETVARLDELYQNHSDIPQIAFEYAAGLANLTMAQDLKGGTETVARLDALYQNHPDHPGIAVAYARALRSLAFAQDLKGCMETVARLRTVYQKYPKISDIAVSYAKGLLALNCKQDLKECTESVAQLKTLYQKHSNISEIVDVYATGLLNLTVDKDLKGCTEAVARLEALYQKHPEIPGIADTYAKGLSNLTVDKDLKGCTEAVTRLEALYQKHPEIPETANSYAKGLFNLTVYQDLKGRTETIVRLEALYQSHPGIPEIAIVYACGLINLAGKQDLKGRAETIARLNLLYQNNPDITRVMPVDWGVVMSQ